MEEIKEIHFVAVLNSKRSVFFHHVDITGLVYIIFYSPYNLSLFLSVTEAKISDGYWR